MDPKRLKNVIKIDNNIRLSSITFYNYKAFRHYSIDIENINILVGPNNCGKSTAIGALRILRVALKKAKQRNPELVNGPDGLTHGYRILEENLPVSIENIHNEYEDTETTIKFKFNNGNTLILYSPVAGGIYLLAESKRATIKSAAIFNIEFPISVAVVPVLGPLEHREKLVEKETVVRELETHRASRHFRNYWHHFPENFENFSTRVSQTWPTMEIQRPERPNYLAKEISMFCTENRIPRELYWSGFGFQVWCQLLTHICRSSGANIIVVDEPEIYLHPDVQRQLLGILRELGPDVIMATHSTEIIAEAEPNEILIVDKKKRAAQRLKDVEGVQGALQQLGSLQNITLTQLAKNRRIIFVEGSSDFKVIRRFAKKLGYDDLASAVDVTPIDSEGFSSWERIKSYSWGIQKTLTNSLLIFAIFDRDYFCDDEIQRVVSGLESSGVEVHIHARKEIENYLLQYEPLQRAINKILRIRSEGSDVVVDVRKLIINLTDEIKTSVQSQYSSKKVDFFSKGARDNSTLIAEALEKFEKQWNDIEARLCVIPGKEVLAKLRTCLQEKYKITVSDAAILESYNRKDIPEDIFKLIEDLEVFRKKKST